MPILAATRWPNNAHMIRDAARLGYLRKTDRVLDPTYGKGIWWKEWKPRRLVKHDVVMDGVDFRNLPHPDGHFDVVAFDPPYVSAGGRATTTIKAFYDQYGLRDAPTSPALLQRLINDGLTEQHRVVKKRGFVLCKTMNYVSSGHLWLGVHETIEHAQFLGFEVWDMLLFLGDARMQPKRTRKDGQKVRQQHARQNYSTLLVLKKKRA